MSRTLRTWVLILTLIALAVGTTACVDLDAYGRSSDTEEVGVSWIANPVDSICGLDDPRMLSNPAHIDYPRVLNSTPEMKTMRDRDIDPNSPAGIQLKTKAVDRVRNAAEKARITFGHCSVWKHISHKDGREVPNLTSQVLALL